MTKITGKKVLVTGGANGIGKLLGEKCLREGASDLVIWDINAENLEKTTKEFTDKGYNVHPYLVDVSDLEDITRAATLTLAEVGRIDILFNNAGIVVGKYFYEHSHKEIEKTIRVNVLGVMHVARCFVGEMIKQKSGHIVNIASAAGLLANPKMSVYVGSKWAVLGWSESLRLELEEMEGDLHVTTVCPSYIKTGMFEGVEAPLLAPLLEPEEITDQIIRAVKCNEIEVKAPWSVHLIPILRGIMPTRLFDLIVGKGLNIYNSMANFIGRPPKEAIPEKEKLQNKS
ncbi:MAG: SDR family oxidoreductase [Raineya sp.]|nr:SDR family oxidoreductase [Raineya sp.]MDW8295709.1 SDR family oxidoreductase [Raineya sp.]